MIDLRISARGRPGWNEWKLGDSILVCSVFAHIGGTIRLNADMSHTGIRLIKNLSDNVFSDKYTLLVENGFVGDVVFPDQFMLEHNVDVVSYTKKPDYLNYYYTTQFYSKGDRSLPQLDISTLIDPNSAAEINLDRAELKYPNIRDIFDVMSNAKMHIGCASGMAWVAMSCATQGKIFLPKTFRQNKGWDYALEIMYRNKNLTIKDI